MKTISMKGRRGAAMIWLIAFAGLVLSFRAHGQVLGVQARAQLGTTIRSYEPLPPAFQSFAPTGVPSGLVGPSGGLSFVGPSGVLRDFGPSVGGGLLQPQLLQAIIQPYDGLYAIDPVLRRQYLERWRKIERRDRAWVAKQREAMEELAKSQIDEYEQIVKDQERALRAISSREPVPYLRAYTEAIDREPAVDGDIGALLPKYLSEANSFQQGKLESEVFMRAVCFPRGRMTVDRSRASVKNALGEAVEAVKSGKREKPTVFVLGLASGQADFNELVAWGRAANVVDALKAELEGVPVYGAGAYKLQSAGLKIEPAHLQKWFGQSAELAPGPDAEVDRAQQCAIIFVLPANTKWHNAVRLATAKWRLG